jgi:aspartokinase
MRMPSSIAVHGHLQSWTVSYRRFIVALVASSMDGTTRMLLDIAREEVDIRTHGIIHLETHMEMQDAELEERVELIADLEQQLLKLQGQAPPEPANPEEIDAMSGIDED